MNYKITNESIIRNFNLNKLIDLVFKLFISFNLIYFFKVNNKHLFNWTLK